MKTGMIICLIVSMHCFMHTASAQQNIISSPVDFVIRQLNFNDSILRAVVDFQTDDGAMNPLMGRGVLSICGCYCDSIWDAWPVSEPDSLLVPGTGTIHYAAGDQGGTPGQFPQSGPQNAVLGIRHVQGGITRDSDFNVWMKYVPGDFD